MYFKELTLRSFLPEKISTEIMYEIASARADNVELIRINILKEEEKDVPQAKRTSTVIRLLKNMKQDGRIQFFATEKSFDSHSTEAVFLQNKYPDVLSSEPQGIEGEIFIYIKI